MTIKTTIAASLTAVALMGSSAFAADIVTKAPKKAPEPTSCFDVAFGGGLQSDYNFRGISQSDKGPGVYGYVEPRCNVTKDIQLYVGVWGWSTKLPTTPTGEFDLYGGVRVTVDKFAFDFGAMYYWYPNETQLFIDGLGNLTNTVTATPFTVRDTDFWEVYGKVTYTATDWLSINPYVYYSPDYLRTGANATYAGGIVKVTLPSAWFPSDWGAYVSGEAAHYWIGTFTAFGAPFDLPDYTTWNVGIGATYKVFTVDVRYYDTDLTKENCQLLTGDPSGFASNSSKWCSATVIGKISFDLTLNSNIK
jgi:uncharacterized protein (TIGR02001 family)